MQNLCRLKYLSTITFIYFSQVASSISSTIDIDKEDLKYACQILYEEENVAPAIKTVIVTGASGGIGSTAAAYLVKHGYEVLLIGRNEDKLKPLKHEFNKLSHEKGWVSLYHDYIVADYADECSLEHYNKFLKGRNKKLSGVVLITPRPDLRSSIFPETVKWDAMWKKCFTGPQHLLQLSISYLQEGGKIVIIGGITSVQILASYGHYGTLRAAWLSYNKALAYNLGVKRISSNMLSPGGVLTSTFKQGVLKRAEQNKKSYEDQLSSETSNIPLKQYATPKDVAQAIEFLLSNRSNHINGINLLIDGGFTNAY